MKPGLITLTTDFGAGSYYVASMKGVMLAINPTVSIIDACHAIAPQNVRQGAFVLAQLVETFPADTLHVAVVDPGVGTSRAIVYAKMGGQHFLAPDNGLLHLVAARHPPERVVAPENPQWWRHPVSPTFHGRDILAPVAAHLSLGVDPEELGPSRPGLAQLDWPQPRVAPNAIDGEVLFGDSFGNLITNIPAALLLEVPKDRVVVTLDSHETTGIYTTYADMPPETLLALVGSSGYLEIAVTEDSAAELLGVRGAVPVRLAWG
jgi:S-adenosylmethionine hydrolase